jgi:FdhD protein
MPRQGIGAISITKVDGKRESSAQDIVALEEPLEIRLGYGSEERLQKSISVTMRTPGHDFELALGFLFSEAIINQMSDVENIHYCEDVGKHEEKENVVRVELAREVQPDLESLERNFYVSSSCGVCGKSSIDAVEVSCSVLSDSSSASRELIFSLPKELESKQYLFSVTGGIHASGLFDLQGNLIFLREDIGRHNAVDKIIGAVLAKKNINFSKTILLLSGRAGFELVQKAIRAGIPIVASVGAPSSLAVQLDNNFNLTLVGFLRNKTCNIYSGKERIV